MNEREGENIENYSIHGCKLKTLARSSRTYIDVLRIKVERHVAGEKRKRGW